MHFQQYLFDHQDTQKARQNPEGRRTLLGIDSSILWNYLFQSTSQPGRVNMILKQRRWRSFLPNRLYKTVNFSGHIDPQSKCSERLFC